MVGRVVTGTVEVEIYGPQIGESVAVEGSRLERVPPAGAFGKTCSGNTLVQRGPYAALTTLTTICLSCGLRRCSHR